MNCNMDRRRFIAAGLTGVAAVLVQYSMERLADPTTHLNGSPGKSAILTHLQEISILGQSYLSRYSTSVDRAALTRLAHQLSLARSNAASHQLLSRISAQSRSEFASGQTVLVDGWVLAKSEANLFATVHLMSSGHVY